jgi:hypothetical protein
MIYLQPGGTFRIRHAMETLPPGEAQDPRPVSPPNPPPGAEPTGFVTNDGYETGPPLLERFGRFSIPLAILEHATSAFRCGTVLVAH